MLPMPILVLSLGAPLILKAIVISKSHHNVTLFGRCTIYLYNNFFQKLSFQSDKLTLLRLNLQWLNFDCPVLKDTRTKCTSIGCISKLNIIIRKIAYIERKKKKKQFCIQTQVQHKAYIIWWQDNRFLKYCVKRQKWVIYEVFSKLYKA